MTCNQAKGLPRGKKGEIPYNSMASLDRTGKTRKEDRGGRKQSVAKRDESMKGWLRVTDHSFLVSLSRFTGAIS
jgi:hypothetical protein